jgi:hypothetical protein
MFECECGQAIYKQSGDDRLVCYECGCDYGPVFNRLEAIHVLCPRCSAKITDVGREYDRGSDRWRVDNLDCPRCDYQFVTW